MKNTQRAFMAVGGTRRSARFAGFLLVATTATLPPVSTVAQSPDGNSSITEEIINCGSIEEDGQRLACFDRSVAPLLGENDDDTDDAAMVFVGEGDWTSDIFTMDQEWRMSWRSTAVQLTVEIRNSDDYLVSLAATQIGEGGGTSTRFDPGDYRVDVRAFNGEWRLLLVEE
jgi:hypothetical protein